jgi:hypothetical protein
MTVERQKMRFVVDKFSIMERIKREIADGKGFSVGLWDESFFLLARSVPVSLLRARSIPSP